MDRPILMNGLMVRATLRDVDPKTQTRRIVKPQPDRFTVPGRFHEIVSAGKVHICPYGQPGDRLVVKEAAWVWCRKERDGDTKTGRPKYNYIPKGRFVHYQTDEQKPTYRVNEAPDQGWRLKVGRYLPRWASRITLEVTGVRVERLQDISEEDAKAEGVLPIFEQFPCMGRDQRMTSGELMADAPYRAALALLWDQINGDRALWKENPWVWVVEFKRKRIEVK